MLLQVRFSLSLLLCVITLTVTALASGEPREIGGETAKATSRTHHERPHPVEAVEGDTTEMLIPRDLKIEHHVVGAGLVGERTISESVAVDQTCRQDPTSVYCNTLSPWFANLASEPGEISSDDITVAAVAGCELDRYVILVTGNSYAGGVGGYAVDAALYPTSPSFGDVAPIPGTECHAAFEDNGIKKITCTAPPGVALPQTFHLGIRADRSYCGVAVGAPALKGFSADIKGRYWPSDDDHQYGRHASCYAEVYVRGNCSPAFPAYKSDMLDDSYYRYADEHRVADDLKLTVPNCNMIAYEVVVKGNGVTSVDLRSELIDDDPEFGGLIEGTAGSITSSGDLVVKRFDFDPPIPLPGSDLWVTFRTNTYLVGPMLTERPPELGENENALALYIEGRWRFGPANARYAAIDVTIFCEGSPPVGACCDMIFIEDGTCLGGENAGRSCTHDFDCGARGSICVGDSVCYDNMPQMNCPFERWLEGETCKSGPFDPPCGVSACCTLHNCLNLTQRECANQPPVDEPGMRSFQPGVYCGDDDQSCPWVSCFIRADADCWQPGEHVGCDDPQCCTSVCDIDGFCCTFGWDELCALRVYEVCSDRPPNDRCWVPYREGAALLDIPSTVLVPMRTATASPTDPGVCCHADDPGDNAVGTVWYKFVAPPPAEGNEYSSVKLSTCVVQPAETQDSVIQVFRPQNPDRGVCDDGTMCSLSLGNCLDGSTCVLDEQAACENLTLIACADDTGCAGTGAPANASVCVPHLTPGETYYVMVGAKDSENQETYRLDVSSPCDALPLLPNDICSNADRVSGGALTIPFDLSGGGDYQTATLGCQDPPSVLPNMQNDVWYDWVAPCTGLVYIETCDRGMPEPQQPNTTMVMYEGCGCPADDSQIIADSDACVFGCGLSSCIWTNVTEGRCYKIRLGGHYGGTPAGNLKLNVDSNCVSMVRFIDPPNGTVDARRPHPPNSLETSEGIDRGSTPWLSNPSSISQIRRCGRSVSRPLGVLRTVWRASSIMVTGRLLSDSTGPWCATRSLRPLMLRELVRGTPARSRSTRGMLMHAAKRTPRMSKL